MIVFLSHSSKDKPIARRIKKDLKSLHVNAWLDEAEIRVGESIPEKIAEGISACDIFCFIISEDSINSRWVKRELNSFIPKLIEKDAVILPCKMDGADLPQLLLDYRYADFRGPYEIGFQELANAIALKEEIDKNRQIEKVILNLFQKYTKDQILSNVDKYFKDGGICLFGPNRHFEVPVFVQEIDSLLDNYSDAGEIILRFTKKDKFVEILKKMKIDNYTKPDNPNSAVVKSRATD